MDWISPVPGSSIGYTGLLAGPPLIGMVAEASSLRLGIAVIGLAGLLIAALAGILAASKGAGCHPERSEGAITGVMSPSLRSG
jgi:hypothetical protein